MPLGGADPLSITARTVAAPDPGRDGLDDRPGAAHVVVQADSDGVSRLRDLYHHQPLRVLAPRERDGGCFNAAIVCLSGGLVSGDRIDQRVAVEAGARARVVGQAAEKAYRSDGRGVTLDTALTIGEDAWLEWLPQDTILFNGTRLDRRTRVRRAATGRLMAGSLLVFGREAHGERLDRGRLRDRVDLCDAEERLIWQDRLILDAGSEGPLGRRFGFDGARAAATLIYAGPDAETLLPAARTLTARSATQSLGDAAPAVGCTLVRGALVTRWLGRNALALRSAFADYWAALRHQASGLPATLPRLWSV